MTLNRVHAGLLQVSRKNARRASEVEISTRLLKVEERDRRKYADQRDHNEQFQHTKAGRSAEVFFDYSKTHYLFTNCHQVGNYSSLLFFSLVSKRATTPLSIARVGPRGFRRETPHILHCGGVELHAPLPKVPVWKPISLYFHGERQFMFAYDGHSAQSPRRRFPGGPDEEASVRSLFLTMNRWGKLL